MRCNFLYIDDEKDIPFENLNEEIFRCPKCRSSKKIL